MTEHDALFGAEDDATRAAVERIISQWPIRLPDPGLDGPITVNPITWEVIEPLSVVIRNPEP